MTLIAVLPYLACHQVIRTLSTQRERYRSVKCIYL